MSFLRARSPVTPKMTSPHGPAMRGSLRSCGSRSGLVCSRPGTAFTDGSPQRLPHLLEPGRPVGDVQAQHRPAVIGEHLSVADGLGGEDLVPARTFPGNRPTTSIMAPALTPSVLGQLIALYEHITFVEGAVWGIDSFDQWGVELGKQLAQQVTPAVKGDEKALTKQDASTQSLITYYRAHRS